MTRRRLASAAHNMQTIREHGQGEGHLVRRPRRKLSELGRAERRFRRAFKGLVGS